MIVEPSQKRAEETRLDAGIPRRRRGSPKCFFDLIDEHDARSHRVRGGESPPDVLLCLTDQRTVERPDVERQCRATGLATERFRRGALAGAWNSQTEDAARSAANVVAHRAQQSPFAEGFERGKPPEF
jgi:hypothetical protein